MKRTCIACLVVVASLLVSGGAAGVTVTVNQSGGGDFTSIQAAIDSGADEVIITDSANYVENLQIGDLDTGGKPVTLTSPYWGANRPVITPAEPKVYPEPQSTRTAGFGLFSNGSVVRNLILEGTGADLFAGTDGAIFVCANNVLIDNCLFRPAATSTSNMGPGTAFIFFAKQGTPNNYPNPGDPRVIVPGGRNCDGCVVRDCEFDGCAVGVDREPTTPTADPAVKRGWGDTAQADIFIRLDHYTLADEVVNITITGCYFHHSRDSGIFPSNRGDFGGDLNITITHSRFDAFWKFGARGRGANMFVDHSVFTRVLQGDTSDTENSAVAIQAQDGHVPNGSVSNCVFVNCGSAYAQKAYYGGVNNHNGDTFGVDLCTFDKCLNGASVGTGTPASGHEEKMLVSNSIFHRIGAESPPAFDKDAYMIGPEELVDGLYPAWSAGLVNFRTSCCAVNAIWTAAFNNYNTPDLPDQPYMVVDTCLVGEIASEDTRNWDDVVTGGLGLKDNVLGSRLSCGYLGADAAVRGLETVTRATPVFRNTDPTDVAPYWLDDSSPGQGLGAKICWADFDTDNDVDLADFLFFQSCFNGPNRPGGQPGCGLADLDRDADVDLADFLVFQSCFNGPNRAPACP